MRNTPVCVKREEAHMIQRNVKEVWCQFCCYISGTGILLTNEC